MNHKKILFVTHESLERTAVSQAMFGDVAKYLCKKNFDVSIFSADTIKKNFFKDGVKYYSYRRNAYKRFDIKSVLDLYLASFSFISLVIKNDYIYFRSYPSIIAFGIWAMLANKKIIFDTRGLFFEELTDSGKYTPYFIKSFFNLIESFILRIADQIICVTQSQCNFYKEKYSHSRQNYYVIPNCAPKLDVRKNVTNQNQLKLLYVGSLIKWHSPQFISDICLCLQKKGIDFELCVMTKDIDTANTFFKHILNKKILTHDYRNQPEKHHYGFNLITGGISKKVCFPVKFIEYIHSGTRVISSDNVDICKELTEKYNIGFTINLSEDPEAVAMKIINDFKHYPHLENFDHDAYTFSKQCNLIFELINKL